MISSSINNILDQAAERLPDALITLVVGVVVIELMIMALGPLLRLTKLRSGLRRVLQAIIRAFLWITLFIAIIKALGLNNVFVALTGSTVILALLLSTGVAPLITDMISGLFLGNDREFQPGARVIAGDKQTEGVVENVDMRKIRIRDKSGKLHVIPNSLVEKNEWVILEPRSKRASSKKKASLKKR